MVNVKISIVVVVAQTNPTRIELARCSLNSLYDSIKHLPCELIVVDNGGDLAASLELAKLDYITHYIKNSSNLYYGYARNQAIKLASGEYLVTCDDDLIYEKGWLEKCIEVLEKGFKIATPMPIIRCHRKYTRKQIVDGEEYNINAFVGSNCYVLRMEDFKKIGYFREDTVRSGTEWPQRFARMGYMVCAVPDCGVVDEGVNIGIRWKAINRMPIKKKLVNGEEITLCDSALL